MNSASVSTEPASHSRRWSAAGRFVAAGLLLLAASCATYWTWLGWDMASPGEAGGPYEVWQVAGCVLTLFVVTVAAGVRRQAWAASLVLPASFTAAWSLEAQAVDESGLWAVGAILLFVGMTVSVPCVAVLAQLVGRRRHGS